MNKIIDVTTENVQHETLFCVRDLKNPGFNIKQKWFNNTYQEGLKLKILKSSDDIPIAFIEYVPAENAWRPVCAPGYMFIHCMYIYYKDDKNRGFGSILVNACEEDARSQDMLGVTVMTSKGTWITNKTLFEKNGVEQVDKKGRFELMVKKFNEDTPDPQLIDWTVNQDKYQGWHLIYADQCPWHEKSVQMLKEVAEEASIVLNINKITTAKEAQNAPSGFGTFSLLYNGKLLEDHYLSQTRFRNILKKEL